MEKLHEDIMLNILLRLPEQSIVNCKLVCKPWEVLLSNTKLSLLLLVGRHIMCRFKQLCGFNQLCDGTHYADIDMHGNYSYKTLAKFDNHPFAPPDLLSELVASCNGLVCISVEHDLLYDPIYICNPNTGESVYLPKYILSDEDYDGGQQGFFISGFGYNYRTDEYKVVRMYAGCSYPTLGLSLKVQVYTLGSGLGWRNKGRVEFFISLRSVSVCANGALHWIEYKKRKIVAFDLADEKFILIPVPSVISLKMIGEATLNVLGGYLSVFHAVKEEQGMFINIWSLQKKKKCNSYDMGEDEFHNYWNWNKEFSIPWDDTKAKYCRWYRPLAVTKSNQVLLLLNGVLFCYDSKTATLKKLWDDQPRLHVEASQHLNSLVSLAALGEQSSMPPAQVQLSKLDLGPSMPPALKRQKH